MSNSLPEILAPSLACLHGTDENDGGNGYSDGGNHAIPTDKVGINLPAQLYPIKNKTFDKDWRGRWPNGDASADWSLVGYGWEIPCGGRGLKPALIFAQIAWLQGIDALAARSLVFCVAKRLKLTTKQATELVALAKGGRGHA